MKTKLILTTALVVMSTALLAPSLSSANPIDPGAKQRYANNSGRPGGYLEGEVRHELLMLPYYSVFDDLQFRVDGYKVILMGEVVRPTLRSDAENVVKRIEGVEKVDNRIKVLPVSLFDDRIRLMTYRAIYRHPTMTRYAIQPVPPIHIIVDHGNVMLVGVVANQMDSNIAYIQARGVPDAFSVTNRLRVEK